MKTLPDHFAELLTAIEPKGERLALTQSIPHNIRDFLKTTDKIETSEPHTLLVGSYARQTAINDIKDVDIILRVKNSYRQGSAEDILETLFSALGDLPKYLDDTGEVRVRRRQHRSINVHLQKADIQLDIVPAVAIDGIDAPLEIPDQEWSKWVQTHPLGYGNALSTLNGENDLKVKPLVKMLKHWRDVHMAYRRPKSYWLECLVYHHINTGAVVTEGKSYAELFADLLCAIDVQFRPCVDKGKSVPSIADPMLGHNVAHNWERDAFEAFMTRIATSLNWALRALEEGDENEAAKLWQNVFGIEKFPESRGAIKGMQVQRALTAGTMFVTPQLKVLTDTPLQPAKNVPIQRFYGSEGK